MKIQTTANLTSLKNDGQDIRLSEHHKIELEFSAIDTGGGFKDPMLDFSIPLKKSIEWSDAHPDMSLTLADPDNENKKVNFSFSGEVTLSNHQINGRIKENQLNREVIGFVLNLLR